MIATIDVGGLRVGSRCGRRDRYSFPLFFDPSWDARVTRLPNAPAPTEDAEARWDRASVHAFDGTWGEYLMAKISRVFPALMH